MRELLGIARFKFHEGKVEEFKRLSARCMEIVRTQDTGTLQYGIYFNDDQSECIVLERYRDSEALIEHGAHIGEDLMEAVVATGSVEGELLGEPSASSGEDGRRRGPPLHALPVDVDTARRPGYLCLEQGERWPSCETHDQSSGCSVAAGWEAAGLD